MDIKQRERAFLIGLEKLTRETGIIISGCGCCGSPSIDDSSAEQLGGDDSGYGLGDHKEVIWVSENDDYAWKYHKKSIVKTIGE